MNGPACSAAFFGGKLLTHHVGRPVIKSHVFFLASLLLLFHQNRVCFCTSFRFGLASRPEKVFCDNPLVIARRIFLFEFRRRTSACLHCSTPTASLIAKFHQTCRF
ncbi:unnamed protein product [Kuraishia capsulata CBS 1993]|uniref:Uncharacterized protein n=1 Tax=Kuraishia capsulata CBS 1993 TaxID=1382522 RepID=W6MP06_9ASCO|nr:uncharacterized protein KUCA_T00004343001 [Kuraishia capsulata CBS 1993]CDK28361.1 unnamed protein product [Kuraishia capsulata CBS 1993]